MRAAAVNRARSGIVAPRRFAMAPSFPSLIAMTPARLGARHAGNAVGFQVASAILGAALPSIVKVLVGPFGLQAVGSRHFILQDERPCLRARYFMGMPSPSPRVEGIVDGGRSARLLDFRRVLLDKASTTESKEELPRCSLEDHFLCSPPDSLVDRSCSTIM
jgi:hypothetical protein